MTGEKVVVPAGTAAAAFVVTTADGLYLVDASASGVTVERQDNSAGPPYARVTFASAPGRKLGGVEANQWLNDHIAAAVSVMTSAACETVLSLTAAAMWSLSHWLASTPPSLRPGADANVTRA